MLQNEDNQRGDGVCVERATVDHFLSHSSVPLPLPSTSYVQYIPVYQGSILYSSLHTMHYCIACLCLKESKDSPSFTYLTLTNR